MSERLAITRRPLRDSNELKLYDVPKPGSSPLPEQLVMIARQVLVDDPRREVAHLVRESVADAF